MVTDNVSPNSTTFWSELAPAANNAGLSTLQALSDYQRLVSIVLIQVHSLISPSIISITQRAVIIFLEQPRDVIIKQLSVFFLSICLLYIVKRYHVIRRARNVYRSITRKVTDRYRRVLSSISAKSRFAAFCLPHVLYISAAAVFQYSIGRNFISYLATWGLIFCAFVLPEWRILRALYVLIDVVYQHQLDEHLIDNQLVNNYTTPTISSTAVTTTPSHVHASPNNLIQTNANLHHRQSNATPPTVTVLQSAPPISLPSDVIRRRRAARILDAESLRQRASLVAQSIEEEGKGIKEKNEGDKQENDDENVDNENIIKSARQEQPINSRLLNSTSLLATAPRLRRRRPSTPRASPTPSTALKTVSTTTTPKSRSKRGALKKQQSLTLSQMSEDVKQLREECKLLRFCIVFSICWIPRAVLSYLFPTVLQSVIRFTDLWLFYFVIWMEWSFTSGADLIYNILIANVSRRSGFIERTTNHTINNVQDAILNSTNNINNNTTNTSNNNNDNTDVQQIGLVLRIVSSLNIKNWMSKKQIWYFITETKVGVYLSALCFLLIVMLPTLIVLPLTIMISILWPCWSTVHVLEVERTKSTYDLYNSEQRENKRQVKQNEQNSNFEIDEINRQNLLAYWSVFSVIEIFYTLSSNSLSWVPFWFNIKLAIIVWLQFHAAAPNLIDWFVVKVSFFLSIAKQSIVNVRSWKRRSSSPLSTATAGN